MKSLGRFKLDRNHWKTKYFEFPTWTCPTCKRGQLIAINKSLNNNETPQSVKMHSLTEWEPDWIEGRFSVHLKCSDVKCGESAVVAGRSGCDYNQFYDDEGQPDAEMRDIYYPKYMYPSPYVIDIPEETPVEIREEIYNATSLIWINDSSCANKLRLTIERVLTALKIPKTTLNRNNKRVLLSLDSRIAKLPPERSEIAELLHSVRNLGNQASHESFDGIDRNDLLTIFEIIEHVLHLAFSNKSYKIVKAAKDINKRKGKPRKK